MFDKKILLHHLNKAPLPSPRKAPLHEQKKEDHLGKYSRAVFDQFSTHIENHHMDSEDFDGSDLQASGGRDYQGSAGEEGMLGAAHERLHDFVSDLHQAGVEEMRPHIARKFGIDPNHRDWEHVGPSPQMKNNPFSFDAIQKGLGFRPPKV